MSDISIEARKPRMKGNDHMEIVTDGLVSQPLEAASGYPAVDGRCVSCGEHSLYLGPGGTVVCAYLKCDKPTATDHLLSGRDRKENPEKEKDIRLLIDEIQQEIESVRAAIASTQQLSANIEQYLTGDPRTLPLYKLGYEEGKRVGKVEGFDSGYMAGIRDSRPM